MDTPHHSVLLEKGERRDSIVAEKLESRSSTPSLTSEPFIQSVQGSNNRCASCKFDEHFLGPRALDRHSKWPMMLRIHGSCLPDLILPLIVVGSWTTGVCLFSRHVHDLAIKSTLLTVLGFVVALSLSVRSTTAYERYMEGRRAWTTLMTTSHHLARNIWINVKEREGQEKDDLLAKITALNLIVAFARALKHRLRFEPYTHYNDIRDLVKHLNTFAREATELEPDRDEAHKKSFWKSYGEYLGVSFAMSNPRKMIKRAEHPLGNLPLEILNHLAVYIHDVIDEDRLNPPPYQANVLSATLTLNEILETTDRILNTPLPLAYSIAISQLTWVYILILPFQLYESLGFITIPGTLRREIPFPTPTPMYSPNPQR
ncbi:unnamed protein product [Periconia digitata]|uniref:Bestrophin homolog n=1 Tax=Periconia digitata TaxID=1303443 RepID=A0A9W4U3Z2_9PLEO|nr:unnamed protein product [Periconia digitata]